MPNIKAVIADVDGVMVGNVSGVNFPLPHTDVIMALQAIAAAGIPIVLCTAKFSFAIKKIVQLSGLNNPHITDGGALIINFIADTVLSKHTIEKDIVTQFTRLCLEQGIYLELCSAESYYMQASQVAPFTEKRSHVLQKSPTIVDSLFSVAENQAVIKMLAFTEGQAEAEQLERIAQQLDKKIHFIWSHHPYLVPKNIGVITAPHVSKANAAREVIDSLGLSFNETLGIGDSQSDWNFMSLCHSVGTVGPDEKLLTLAKTKGRGNYYLASSVDDHGMLEILKYFKVIS